MKRWIGGAAIVLALAGCQGTSTEIAKAHIIERKALANGKVRVNYVFTAGEQKQVKDSADVDGRKVVPHDSVSVRFSANDPLENQIQLP
ncbi:hypothetical protein HNQ91_000392 [Filimonas zeae]|uniref:Uncharacterized protein n=1 Tax=Filimonas zeae TaxID=1737353 RepID=A0A917ILU9_9BACT|nr:hypothetical protein [Filimonas zeae]MDR6337370.1 hypothetical protein [Filimonas zeae]GGH58283.1 hypothetical protein GCM10011379_03850 [Filimonas zeae]